MILVTNQLRLMVSGDKDLWRQWKDGYRDGFSHKTIVTSPEMLCLLPARVTV